MRRVHISDCSDCSSDSSKQLKIVLSEEENIAYCDEASTGNRYTDNSLSDGLVDNYVNVPTGPVVEHEIVDSTSGNAMMDNIEYQQMMANDPRTDEDLSNINPAVSSSSQLPVIDKNTVIAIKDSEDDNDDHCINTASNHRQVIDQHRSSNSSEEIRRSKGRQKIAIEYIESKNRRLTTFSKRKNGLMKKARELALLTNCDLMLVVISETRQAYCTATPSLNDLFDRNDIASNILQRLATRNKDCIINEAEMPQRSGCYHSSLTNAISQSVRSKRPRPSIQQRASISRADSTIIDASTYPIPREANNRHQIEKPMIINNDSKHQYVMYNKPVDFRGVVPSILTPIPSFSYPDGVATSSAYAHRRHVYYTVPDESLNGSCHGANDSNKIRYR